jgi:hypothetical protein
MAQFLDLTVDFLSYAASSATNDPADAISAKVKVSEDTVNKISRQQMIVADSTVDQAIALPDASSDYLVIFVDRQVSVKLNGSSTALVLKPKTNGKKVPALVWRGTITSLSVSNSSGGAANIDVIAANLP